MCIRDFFNSLFSNSSNDLTIEQKQQQDKIFRICTIIFILVLVLLLIILISNVFHKSSRQKLAQTVNKINGTLDGLREVYYKNCQGTAANSEGCKALDNVIKEQNSALEKLQGLIKTLKKN